MRSKGLISRKDISAEISPNSGQGIVFVVGGSKIKASFKNISNTSRNTVLSDGIKSACLTEHFLAAAALADLKHVDVELEEEELPFGDGSAKLWIDFFKEEGLIKKPSPKYTLAKEILIKDPEDKSKYIIAKPSNEPCKLSYHMDWPHPKIGKQSYSWQLGANIHDLADARTFSNELENQMLGLSGWIVGITEDSFTMPLRFPDEELPFHWPVAKAGSLPGCPMPQTQWPWGCWPEQRPACRSGGLPLFRCPDLQM